MSRQLVQLCLGEGAGISHTEACRKEGSYSGWQPYSLVLSDVTKDHTIGKSETCHNVKSHIDILSFVRVCILMFAFSLPWILQWFESACEQPFTLAVTSVMWPNVRWVHLLNYSPIEKTQWGSINQTLLVFSLWDPCLHYKTSNATFTQICRKKMCLRTQSKPCFKKIR